MVRSTFPRARPVTTLLRFAGLVATIGLAMPSSPASAAGVSDDVQRGGAAAVARATATIADAAELRAGALYAASDRYAEVEGHAIEPIGVSYRDCDERGEERRCALVILDLP